MSNNLIPAAETFLQQYNKQLIGFDTLFSRLFNDLPVNTNYPPYNLEKVADNSYKLTVAVAGFGKEDLDIKVANNYLTINGSKKTESDNSNFLFKGIADRAFKLSYQVADYMEVTSAKVENGLLVLDMEEKLPEAKKPKQITVQ